MPIREPVPSEKVNQGLEAGVRDIRGKRPQAQLLLKSSWRVPVFTLNLPDITKGRGLQDAKPAGWRFLASELPDKVAAGDVSEPANGPPKLTAFSDDPRIGEIISAYEKTKEMPEAGGQNYQIRLLRLPALSIEAFWLKADQDENDLLVPFLTHADHIHRLEPIRVGDFVKRTEPLQRIAEMFEQIKD